MCTFIDHHACIEQVLHSKRQVHAILSCSLFEILFWVLKTA